jgi:phage gp46-like protein
MADFVDTVFAPADELWLPRMDVASNLTSAIFEDDPWLSLRPDDALSGIDQQPPLLTIIPPSGSALAPGETITIEATDDRVLAIVTVYAGDRVIYDGARFSTDYLSSVRTILTDGVRLQVRRTGGWKGTVTIDAAVIDSGGTLRRVVTVYNPPSTLQPGINSLSRRATGFTDVRLFHAQDGGEIELIGGEPVMVAGLETAAYLSLFGGNESDSGLPGDDLKQWWGNFGEAEPARRYRSETQHLLATLPPTTGNLRRLEFAVCNDLAWLIARKRVASVDVRASMPARNRVQLAVWCALVPGEQTITFAHDQAWGG